MEKIGEQIMNDWLNDLLSGSFHTNNTGVLTDEDYTQANDACAKFCCGASEKLQATFKASFLKCRIERRLAA
jgi:hypothetical protein